MHNHILEEYYKLFVFAANSNSIFPISLQAYVVEAWCIKKNIKKIIIEHEFVRYMDQKTIIHIYIW